MATLHGHFEEEELRYSKAKLFKVVEKKLGHVPGDTLDVVCDELFGMQDEFDEPDLTEILQALENAGTSQSSAKSPAISSMHPMDIRTAVRLSSPPRRKMVEEIRLEVFGKRTAPFPNDIEAAAAWEREQLDRISDLDSFVAAIEETAQKIKLGLLSAERWLVWHTDPETYGWVVPGSKLDRVKSVARKLQEDLASGDCDDYILAGLLPERGDISIWPASGTSPMEDDLRISINSPDVPPEWIMEKIQVAIEQRWGRKRTSKPSKRDMALVLFMQDEYQAPLKWPDRLKEWNVAHPVWSYDNHEALRKAYGRARKRIGSG